MSHEDKSGNELGAGDIVTAVIDGEYHKAQVIAHSRFGDVDHVTLHALSPFIRPAASVELRERAAAATAAEPTKTQEPALLDPPQDPAPIAPAMRSNANTTSARHRKPAPRKDANS